MLWKDSCALWAQVEPRLVSCIARRLKPEPMTEALLEAASEEDRRPFVKAFEDCETGSNGGAVSGGDSDTRCSVG